LERFSQIREQVTDIYRSWEASSSAKVRSSLDFSPPSLTVIQAVVVSKQGLEEWLARNQTHLPQPNDEDAGVPEEISISDILCEHGALDPSQASRMKCISEVSTESNARASKLNRKIRVPTRRFRLPDAILRR